MERELPEWMKSSLKRLRNENSNVNQHEPCMCGEINPLLKFNGKIRFSKNFGRCSYVCETILDKLQTIDGELVVGFDLEWPVSYKKGAGQGKTALIQFCPSLRVCYLFHVIEWKKLPRAFVDFISHPKVRLVGCNVKGDIWKLGRDFGIRAADIVANNTIELRCIANKVFSTQTTWSLGRLVLYVLKKHLEKDDSVRTSNWGHDTLTVKQLEYAATDAYACLLTYSKLREVEKIIDNGNSAPPEPVEPGPLRLPRGTDDSEQDSESHENTYGKRRKES